MNASKKAAECGLCGKAFGMFRWRHECESKSCDRTICHACIAPIQLPDEMKKGNFKEFAICRYCHDEAARTIFDDPILRGSKASYDKGYKEGYSKGHKNGYDEGRRDERIRAAITRR